MSGNDAAYKRLCGPDNLKARKIYRALVDHHKTASCPMCTSYPQYGSMVIRGDFFEHIGDIVPFDIDTLDFAKLKNKKLIVVEEITPRQTRIVFVDLVKELMEEKTA